MTNRFAHRLIHHCSETGEVCQLDGRYLPKAGQARAECGECGTVEYQDA